MFCRPGTSCDSERYKLALRLIELWEADAEDLGVLKAVLRRQRREAVGAQHHVAQHMELDVFTYRPS